MTTWEAILLGLVQGLTEFLPVSSSGHLELSQALLGFKNLHQYILFNLVCHLGTLAAIFYFFLPQIKQSLSQKTRFLQLFLATLPLFPLVFILKPIKHLFEPQYLGFCFLLTAGLLFGGVYRRLKRQPRKWMDPLAIGLMQAVAIFPGISRSGATISTAQFLGWKKEEAIQFSFLLAVPAIFGGTVVEAAQFLTHPEQTAALSPLQFLIGFATSFVVGCLALKLLMRMVSQNKWIYFAWYCLFIGLFAIVYFNVLG